MDSPTKDHVDIELQKLDHSINIHDIDLMNNKISVPNRVYHSINIVVVLYALSITIYLIIDPDTSNGYEKAFKKSAIYGITAAECTVAINIFLCAINAAKPKCGWRTPVGALIRFILPLVVHLVTAINAY